MTWEDIQKTAERYAKERYIPNSVVDFMFGAIWALNQTGNLITERAPNKKPEKEENAVEYYGKRLMERGDKVEKSLERLLKHKDEILQFARYGKSDGES